MHSAQIASLGESLANPEIGWHTAITRTATYGDLKKGVFSPNARQNGSRVFAATTIQHVTWEIHFAQNGKLKSGEY
jgi:hypothetical protein